MFKKIVLFWLCQIVTLTAAYAHNTTLPDDHAPIGVMGDHNHKQGEWMAAYRYSHMSMKGTKSGTNDVSAAQVLNNFMVAPLSMDMDMHMFGLMYGVSDSMTIMAMVPYMIKSMKTLDHNGVYASMHTEGLGDIKLTSIYTLFDSGLDKDIGRVKHKLMLNFGASLPTGSIDLRGTTHSGLNKKFAYPMQLGSGTVDPMIGLTYINKYRVWSWGVQTGAVLRFGENSEGYRLGNEYNATSWIARNLNDNIAASLRLNGKSWGDIHGRDSELNPAMSPSARTDLRGGERVDMLAGINLYQTEGALAKNRLAIEFGLPVYQRLDGPQMAEEYSVTLGWQLAF